MTRASDFVRFLIVNVCFLPTLGYAQFDTAPVSNNVKKESAREQLHEEIIRQVSVLENGGNLLKKVVRFATPTVVHIEAFKNNESSLGQSGQFSVEEAGSGVVVEIEKKFYIITNRHVVNNSKLKNIKIRLSDGRFLSPSKVWSDAETDVAILRIQPNGEMVTARLGDSDKMEIGDFVLAVGSPFGLSHSVSYGIVSAKGRRDLELGSDEIRLQDFIQTDAAINPGNSGGPLLNLRGEVIGINTAIASNSGGNEGVSFAIPIKMVMFVSEQLIRKGRVDHAYLGVTLDYSFGPKAAKRLGLNRVRGALVKEVRAKSPAFFANLKVNDVIIGFDGNIVEDDDHLVNLVSLTPVSQTVSLDIIRQRKPLQLKIKVGRRANFEGRKPNN